VSLKTKIIRLNSSRKISFGNKCSLNNYRDLSLITARTVSNLVSIFLLPYPHFKCRLNIFYHLLFFIFSSYYLFSPFIYFSHYLFFHNNFYVLRIFHILRYNYVGVCKYIYVFCYFILIPMQFCKFCMSPHSELIFYAPSCLILFHYSLSLIPFTRSLLFPARI